MEVLIHFGNVLNQIARTGYAATDQACGDLALQKNDQAIIAVVFSALSVEAFINDVSEFAAMSPEDASNSPELIAAFALAMRDVEDSHGPTKLKYLVAHQILTGQPWDKSTQDFENLSLLLSVRDALVHLKPLDRISEGFLSQKELRSSKLLKRLRAKSVLVPEDHRPRSMSWTDCINTRAMARWACNVAAQTSQVIADAFPDGSLKEIIAFKAYKPVD